MKRNKEKFNNLDISIFRSKVEKTQLMNEIQNSITSEYCSANIEKLAFSIRRNNNFKNKITSFNTL